MISWTETALVGVAIALFRPLALLVYSCSFARLDELHDERWLMRERADAFLSPRRWCAPAGAALLLWAGAGDGWRAIDVVHPWRAFFVFVAGIVTWKCVTWDRNLALRRSDLPWRVLALASCVAFASHPAALPVWLFVVVHRLGAWQHHRHLALRLLHVLAALLFARALLAPFMPDVDAPAALVVLVAWVVGAHYVVPAVGKLRLGRRPWTWIRANRLDHLVACAFAWGWGGGLTARRKLAAAALVRRASVPLNLFAVAAEASPALLCLDVRVAIAALAAVALFHVVVFLSSGILFWESTLICVALAACFAAGGDAAAFSWEAWLLQLAALWLGVFKLGVFRPRALSWWDSPYTVVIEWDAVGVGGTRYALTNDFLCPHERRFGRMAGFSSLRTPVLHHHLGQIKRGTVREGVDPLAVRDLVIAADGDRAALVDLARRFGRDVADPDDEAACDRWLVRTFLRLNAGARKRVVPWWLKAPDEQHYRWREGVRYARQEPIARIEVRRRELFHRPDEIVVVSDELLRTIPIQAAEPPSGA